MVFIASQWPDSDRRARARGLRDTRQDAVTCDPRDVLHKNECQLPKLSVYVLVILVLSEIFISIPYEDSQRSGEVVDFSVSALTEF